MKVAVFSDFFYPELSGITDSISLLGKALARRGHSILFTVPRYGARDYAKAHLPQKDPAYGADVFVQRLPSLPYPFSPSGQSRIALPLGQGFFAAKKFAPDIIHTHSPYGPGLEAMVAAKFFTKPLVGTSHMPLSEFIHGPRWFVDGAVGYTSWYYNRCDFVTTPSTSLYDEMKACGFHRPHETVPNPIDLKSFGPAADEQEKKLLKERFGFSAQTILYTGRLAEEKHIDIILHAVALCQKTYPDISLAITGHGTAEKSLWELARELGIEKNVCFLGFIDDATFPLLYKASNLFVIMSTAESQSLSLMQAMASGLPVIGARARALPEYINETNGSVVEPGDYASLSRQIMAILSDPARANRLGQGGILSAAKVAADIVAEKWEKLYTTIIKDRHTHAKS